MNKSSYLFRFTQPIRTKSGRVLPKYPVRIKGIQRVASPPRMSTSVEVFVRSATDQRK